MTIKAKICGLKTKEAIDTAQDNGASMLGFIFAEKSPRDVSGLDISMLGSYAKIPKVAVVQDASDELLAKIVKHLKPEYIQLHGNETKQKAREIKQLYNVKLIRALDPTSQIPEPGLYDFLLFDSPGGGTGKQFNYANFKAPNQPWMLSGGLNAENIGEAVKATGAKFVDVSSGIERERGVKDLELIKKFLKTVNDL